MGGMNRLAVAIGTALTGMLAAGPAVAQVHFHAPECELDTRHFAVKNAVTYLVTATQSADTAKRQQLLQDARRNLREALERGETENASVWYYLGGTSAMLGDYAAADSALDRVEELRPDCINDVNIQRQVAWVPAINEAIDSLRVGDMAGAKRLLHKSNTIYDEDNIGFYYMGRVYAAEGETDSALQYFRHVVEMGPPEDTARQENYDISIFNTALLYSMVEQWDSAIAWFRRYRDVAPDDPDALMGMAEVYALMGSDSLALTIHDSVVARAEHMRPGDLLRAGEAFFRVDRLPDAERAFKAALQHNPYSQPALHNLASTYHIMATTGDVSRARQREIGAQMQEITERLVSLHPHSGPAKRLLASALQLQGKNDSARVVLRESERLTFEVDVDVQQTTQGGFRLEGRVENSSSAELQVPQITFEFLDRDGNVITTETLGPLTLTAEAAEPFSFEPSATTIVGWRYRVGAS